MAVPALFLDHHRRCEPALPPRSQALRQVGDQTALHQLGRRGGRWADGQAGRWACDQAARQPGRRAIRQAGSQSVSQPDRQADRPDGQEIDPQVRGQDAMGSLVLVHRGRRGDARHGAPAVPSSFSGLSLPSSTANHLGSPLLFFVMSFKTLGGTQI